jgi:gliding motility-associated-like protein
MKKFLTIVFILFIGFTLKAQNPSAICQTAQPFCTGSVYTFPASTNAGTAQAGAAYGCLGTQPNPVWYYLQIAQSGTITINMFSTPLVDIDFIAYGPFNNPTAPCVAGLTAATIVDCSYSGAPIENCTLPNTIAGQYYLLLITNFSNQACDITFSQTNAGQAGAGSTNCNLLQCSIDTATIIQSQCYPLTNTFNVTGMISTIYPPNSGQLQVNENTGPFTFINSPFGNPTPYSLGSIQANGQPHQILFSFSADSGCFRTFQYNAPAPCCQSIPTTNAPVCPSAIIQLDANNVPNANYLWQGPSSFTSTIKNPTINNAGPQHVGWYKLTVSINGCFKTDSIFVGLRPTPNLTVFDTSVCIGNQVNIYASGALNYQWETNDFDSTTTVAPTNSRNYQVIGFNQFGCSDTAYLFVEVKSRPILDISAAPYAFCIGNSTTLTVSGATQYTWQPAPVLSSTTGSQVIASPQQNTMIYVTGSFSNGCSSDTSVFLTVYQLPQIIIQPEINPICYGTSTTLNALGASVYQWFPSNSLSSSNGNQVIANPKTNTTYTIYGTDLNGCVNQSTFTLEVKPPISLNLIDSVVICKNQISELIQVQIAGGNGGPYNFEWTNPNYLTGSEAFVRAFPSASKYFKVKVTDGCGTTPAFDSVYVKVNPLPDITAEYDRLICPMDYVIFETPINFIKNCQWNFGNGKTLNKCSNVFAQYANVGSYQVSLQLTDSNNCVNIVDTFKVTVKPNPSADFYTTPDIPNVNEGMIMFFNNSSNDVTQWFWNFNYEYTSSDSCPLFVINRPGRYFAEVEVINQWGCKDKKWRYVEVSDNIDVFIPNSFSPNTDGLNDGFMAKGPRIFSGNFTLMIFNRFGEKIFETSEPSTPWRGEMFKSGTLSPQGTYVYLLKYKTETGQMLEKTGFINLFR